MSKTERRIAEYMMANPDRIIEESAAEIAKAAQVSPASVVRFSKACGYQGLVELKLNLKKESVYQKQKSPLKESQEIQPEDIIRQKMLDYHMQVVRSLLGKWNQGAYTDAVEAILSARHIVLVAQGGSRAAALVLADFFFQLNITCELWEDPSYLRMRIAQLVPGDVLLAFTYTGRYRETVLCTEQAYRQGVTTIGIIGFQKSPIVESLNIVLSTCMEGEEYRESGVSARISELMVVEILYEMLSQKKGLSVENAFQRNSVLENLRIKE